MPDFTTSFENTMKSKAALDAAQAVKLYYELVKSGWDPDKAAMVAFMGIHVFYIPEMIPIPDELKPDPPFFSLPALYTALQNAHSHVSSLLQIIEDDLAFVKEMIPE